MLLIQFIFQSYDVANNGIQADLSLDKYLGADAWSQIYKKLEPQLQEFRNAGDLSKEEEIVNLNRLQLELNISWKKVRTYHKDVVQQFNGRSCDNSCAKVLNVKVRMSSGLDKYKKLHPHEKTTEKNSTETTIDGELSNASTSNAATENRTSNGSTSQSLSQNVEEYVPEPLTDVSSSLNYTPSTLSSSIENVVASQFFDNDIEDVYTPSQKNGKNDSQIVTYTPTKITRTTSRTAAAKKTDLNRNDCTEKKSHKMKKIFGDSGDEIDNNSQNESRHLRSTPET